MKCYTHKDTDAVAVCVNCGKALCNTCATLSLSGRLVCSPGCSAASKQLEDFIVSTHHKAVRGARVTSYFCCGVGVILVLSAIAFYFDVQSWPLTVFVAASGIAFLIASIGNRSGKANP